MQENVEGGATLCEAGKDIVPDLRDLRMENAEDIASYAAAALCLSSNIRTPSR